MNTKENDGRTTLWPSWASVPIASLPEHLFQPTEELAGNGWPDFSPRTLADWTSSAAPPPEVPNDCCLVLCHWRTVPMVAPSADWVFVLHETGGIWDEGKRLLIKRLESGERGITIAHSLARAMAHTNRSAAHAQFDQLIEYRRLLNAAGLDCNDHIQALAEGCYPIDLTEEALAILEIKDALAHAEAEHENHALCLAVLAPNSSEW